ncbi:hypothetical protein CsSME_00048926 [Camellia sinensis var. sinensis]
MDRFDFHPLHLSLINNTRRVRRSPSEFSQFGQKSRAC